MPETTANVVISFHHGNQESAFPLLNLLCTLEEGRPTRYHLQYGNDPATLQEMDTILRFMNQKEAFFSCEIPDIDIPKEMLDNDPNLSRFEGVHTPRTPGQKKAIFKRNLTIYKYIQTLDRFLFLEPDAVPLKHGWLKDIYDEAETSAHPIWGSIEYCNINGSSVPTRHFGPVIYNSSYFRTSDIQEVFHRRTENPWWRHRDFVPTKTQNEAFCGPYISAYDVSIDYLLFASYWTSLSGRTNPLEWTTEQLSQRDDLIYYDPNLNASINDVTSRFLEIVPLIFGIRNNNIRIAAATHFGKITLEKKYPLGGPPDSIIGQNDAPISITKLKNQFLGKRCFIICNGPSLNKTDLSLLKNEYTIGLNRIYLNYDKMGFEPTFLCTVNPHVISQFSEDFSRLNSIRFFRAESRSKLTNHRNTVYMESVGVHEFVADFDHQQWCEGCTVTYCAMQLAFYLGFETVILVGADHFFGDSGTPHKLVEASSADVNHFHPDYFGKGVKWQYPDLERSETSYKNARKAFENAGRIILDATIGGHLTVFPKVDYLSIVTNPSSCETYLDYYDRGKSALAKGNIASAKTLLEKSTELAPNFPAARSALATLCWQAHNPKLALQLITQSLQIAPSHKGVVLNCAEILHQAGNREAAFKLCQTFLNKSTADDEEIRSMVRKLQRQD